MAFYRCVATVNSDGLPKQYTPLSFIAANRRQWLSTPIDTNDYNNVDITFCSLPNTKFVGALCGSDKSVYPINSYNLSRKRIIWLDRMCNLEELSTDTMYRVEFGKTSDKSYYAKINGEDFIITSDNNTLGGKFTLFNGWGGIACAKIYSAKVMLDETVIFNGIPAIRASDNKPGLYDIVSKQFLMNQGTGEFGYQLTDGTYVAPV